MLFAAGEDIVVNAWCVLDLVDQERSAALEVTASGCPSATSAEQQSPVTLLYVLSDSGHRVLLSLDHSVIVMELGGPVDGDAVQQERGEVTAPDTLTWPCRVDAHTCPPTASRAHMPVPLGDAVPVDVAQGGQGGVCVDITIFIVNMVE